LYNKEDRYRSTRPGRLPPQATVFLDKLWIYQALYTPTH